MKGLTTRPYIYKTFFSWIVHFTFQVDGFPVGLLEPGNPPFSFLSCPSLQCLCFTRSPLSKESEALSSSEGNAALPREDAQCSSQETSEPALPSSYRCVWLSWLEVFICKQITISWPLNIMQPQEPLLTTLWLCSPEEEHSLCYVGDLKYWWS